ncbi:DUF397 domain-containing protein [Streptomyces sp. NPDC094437]|uniref:DUF397 domain-containing protein n=1 Tax=Streptomyces sp. NPDC094437 TaxID=3366060 RepID=UPI003824AAD3
MIRNHAVSTELAPEGAWFKSSYSTPEGGGCVEIADLNAEVGIRDSKNTAGPAFVVHAGAWSAFVGLARSESVEL